MNERKNERYTTFILSFVHSLFDSDHLGPYTGTCHADPVVMAFYSHACEFLMRDIIFDFYR